MTEAARRRQLIETGALARLWALPEGTNNGLAAEPRYVLERLQDTAYGQRYAERLGSPVGLETVKVPDAPGMPTPASSAA
jgi:hypothetical protein